ncbi:hypothetical protein DVR12_22015 [Chitinophaga silvatica]|uniref:DUF2975 domain-containing protein n=1 Tax=Chitinophaga silvatica TaxID=2282649 RepID=A0A3E1Y505_9BACT|nr:hypothetical protein [Chitinophaga silvatica]RFS19775.1 hypothetical protein DVR12_22015 [Chitinophaga silvatica]
MNTRKVSHILLAIIFLLIACAFTLFLVALGFVAAEKVVEDSLPVNSEELFNLPIWGMILGCLIGSFSFARLGIRMLNTRYKFFEMPGAKNGVFKLFLSIILSMTGTLLLLTGIYSAIKSIFLTPGSSPKVIEILVRTVFITLVGGAQLWLAYKRRASAFEKPTTEFLGEII